MWSITSSCQKFTEVPFPKTELGSSAIYTDSLTALASLTTIYAQMAQSSSYTVPFLTGLSADELTNYSTNPSVAEFFNDNLGSSNKNVESFWNQAYQYIYYANAAIEGLKGSSGISATFKDQLAGEAYFIRAYWNFYLVSLFNDVPLILTTDYRKNQQAGRTPSALVYQQIISDLTNADQLLSPDYSSFNGERTRPTKWAAKALLSRVYLNLGNWQQAENQSTLLIADSADFRILSDLNTIFLANSEEAIWQLFPVVPNQNTAEGYFFILNGPPNTVSLSNGFVNDFESGDLRRLDWVDSVSTQNSVYYFPYKYKIKTSQTLTEYSMVFRISEQYLIRAEARAQQNNVSGAQADLNVIRNRSGLPNTLADNKAALLSAILQERKHELFCEWGHRWLDLKRTGQTGPVLSSIKPNWKATASLFPIPLKEIQNDPNLTQNPGY